MSKKLPFQSNSVWLFRNIHTNQVIFSLQRVLDVRFLFWQSNVQNKSAVQQFPSPQRRMFPQALRKDHWIPLVHAIFPTHLIANHIYKRLLDYRAWRLTSPPALNLLSFTKKKRKEPSLDQVPTAIADLAHVTKNVEGKMILNWDRMVEKEWARQWSNNIWHCGQGFNLKRGYKIAEYTFPRITEETRKELGWDGKNEPPIDLKQAVERHTSIWEKMHAKTILKRKRVKLFKNRMKLKARKQRKAS